MLLLIFDSRTVNALMRLMFVFNNGTGKFISCSTSLSLSLSLSLSVTVGGSADCDWHSLFVFVSYPFIIQNVDRNMWDDKLAGEHIVRFCTM